MRPSLFSVDEYREFCRQNCSKPVYEYFSSGAHDQITLKDNSTSFNDIKIIPRVLVDVSQISMTTSVLNTECSIPIGISPTAFHKVATPEGELATAKAATKFGTIMILSSFSTTTLEEVALKHPGCNLWFQLHIAKDRNIIRSLVERAEKNSYKAIVLTVDAPIHPVRESVSRYKFDLPLHLELANFVDYKYFKRTRTDTAELFDDSLTWEDVKWLKSLTNLPIVLKGILSPEDAIIASNIGVSGIMVSNHGGRQLDSVPATIDVLESISVALKEHSSNMEIYLDGGIRRGTDVFKAIALGARMIFIGRPIVWGLLYDGYNGAQQIFTLLKTELENAMKLAGTPSISDIEKQKLVTKPLKV